MTRIVAPVLAMIQRTGLVLSGVLRTYEDGTTRTYEDGTLRVQEQ